MHSSWLGVNVPGNLYVLVWEILKGFTLWKHIGVDNGLSPGRHQAIIWTNDEILLIGPLGINFSEISIEICTFSIMKIHLKMSSGKWRPFCLGLNVLNELFAFAISVKSCVECRSSVAHYVDMCWNGIIIFFLNFVYCNSSDGYYRRKKGGLWNGLHHSIHPSVRSFIWLAGPNFVDARTTGPIYSRLSSLETFWPVDVQCLGHLPIRA